MRQTLRLVRSSKPSPGSSFNRKNSQPSPTNYSTRQLGDKLQLLAEHSPVGLRVIESLADTLLEELGFG